jgi:hypothetical protein
MPSINIDLDFYEHPKIVRLVGLLGRGAAELPIRLWIFCAKFHRLGALAGYSAQEIESLVKWWGKPGEAIEALLKVGLLEKADDGTFLAHDFAERQEHLTVYHEKAKHAANARWERVRREGKHPKPPPDAPSIAPSIATSNASSMPRAMLLQGNAAQCSAMQRESPSAASPTACKTTAELAWLFRSRLSRKPNSQETVEDVSAHFDDLTAGRVWSITDLEAEIRSDRKLSETIWALTKRLEKSRPMRSKDAIDGRQAAIDAETEARNREHDERRKNRGSG